MIKIASTVICFIGCFFSFLTLAYSEPDNASNKFDFKLSIEEENKYKGIVLGKLYFIKIDIKNLTDKKYDIGDYFRSLMTLDESSWSQFSMAASGPTNLKSDRISNLKYGYGANSIAQMGEDKQSIVIHIGNMNDVIHDSSAAKWDMKLSDWWPKYLSPKSSVTITWPTFWFSDSNDNPQFMATPSFSCNTEKYYYWVSFKNNKIKEIEANTKTLLKIISNGSEPLGLRAACVAWLLEESIDNEKYLLPYITNKETPKALAYRTIQALMVWGSPKIIDDIFALWKEQKLLPDLDKDMKFYFTWSSHKNAEEAVEKVKSGKR